MELLPGVESRQPDAVIRTASITFMVDRKEPATAVQIASFTFVVEWKGTATAAQVALAAEKVKEIAKTMGPESIPLVVVPFMGEVGRERCDLAGVSWMDLSGNAVILSKNLHIRSTGSPNKYVRRGRPSSVFAPKSSRIARWLLMHPDKEMTQREIASATETDEGYTSRIVQRLEKDELVIKNADGTLRVNNFDLLLDAWREKYDFANHFIERGHVPTRSGEELLRRATEFFKMNQINHAATGLGAAWLMSRFAGFRVATIFLDEIPSKKLLIELGFRREERGANLWLVVPNDKGVFQGGYDVDGVRCVHPVQVYLDLVGHAERAPEAAARLRKEYLNRKRDA